MVLKGHWRYIHDTTYLLLTFIWFKDCNYSRNQSSVSGSNSGLVDVKLV